MQRHPMRINQEIDIITIALLLKLTYRFNIILIKIPAGFSWVLVCLFVSENDKSKIHWENQETQNE